MILKNHLRVVFYFETFYSEVNRYSHQTLNQKVLLHAFLLMEN